MDSISPKVGPSAAEISAPIGDDSRYPTRYRPWMSLNALAVLLPLQNTICYDMLTIVVQMDDRIAE
jgi:hypothetical protein